MLRNLLSRMLGDENERVLARLRPIVTQINQLEEQLQALSEDQLKAKTVEFRTRLAAGETLDDLLPEAFAVVKNACRRLVGQKWEVRGNTVEWQIVPYDVQLLGGIVLHRGEIAEMKTGEGKTLVCTFPLYLNALTGKGCHLVTVNSYLAARDAEWMGGLFRYLGLTVGVIEHGLDTAARIAAYGCDITYGTNSEFGFDYLRDNMARDPSERVQFGGRQIEPGERELHYALVDEVDSILIDEARTPLIISAPADESTDKYAQYAQLIRNLIIDRDYQIDEKQKAATLTEAGIAKMEQLLGLTNIYTEAGFSEVHHIEQALKAQAVFRRDKDYVVREGEVLIVDEFTGRLMPGRRYSDGLHQALEAKEGVQIRRQSRTLATITLQNYFRLYQKLGGMTGTAKTEEEEFAKIYGLKTVVIPTHRAVARQDLPDSVYKNLRGKLTAVIAKIRELHTAGQPVLVGTITIESSERISQLLTQSGVPHKVLNAKYHEQEAEIVARAGERGAVTIATNMAGRGTDIKLGEGVAELGGLFILGTERHESRRIDNQLRGRSGRQGDPGASQFFVSMEDSLMRLFGGEKMQRMMDALSVPDDMPIENSIISHSIENAQKKVEAHNFDIRKHLVSYDDVMNQHREIIYSRRRRILEHASIATEIQKLLHEEADNLVALATSERKASEWDLPQLLQNLSKIIPSNLPLTELERFDRAEELQDFVRGFLAQGYAAQTARFAEPAQLRLAEHQIYLATIDRLWMEHLDAMHSLREQVSLRGYAQRDPLLEYKGEAYQLFEQLLASIRTNTIIALFRLQPTQPLPRVEQPQKIVTNVAEIEDVLTGDRELTPAQAQQLTSAAAQVLRANPAVANLGRSGVTVIRADDLPEINPATAANPNVIRVGAEESGSASAVGRNDPCPCGSGKKFKKCCGSNA